jgi:hypothetical protein
MEAGAGRSPTPRGVVGERASGLLRRGRPYPPQGVLAVATGGPVTVRRYDLPS